MSTSHEILLGIDELGTLSVQCAQCSTEVMLIMMNTPKAPMECRSCGARYDRLFREALDHFINATNSLKDRDHKVVLRVKQPN